MNMIVAVLNLTRNQLDATSLNISTKSIFLTNYIVDLLRNAYNPCKTASH